MMERMHADELPVFFFCVQREGVSRETVVIAWGVRSEGAKAVAESFSTTCEVTIELVLDVCLKA